MESCSSCQNAPTPALRLGGSRSHRPRGDAADTVCSGCRGRRSTARRRSPCGARAFDRVTRLPWARGTVRACQPPPPPTRRAQSPRAVIPVTSRSRAPRRPSPYGLEVLADDIATGRCVHAFAALRALHPSSATATAGTALSFIHPITSRGALFRALGPLARNSDWSCSCSSSQRPLPNSPWRYRFDVVLDGRVFDPSGSTTLLELRTLRELRSSGPIPQRLRGERHDALRKIWDARVGSSEAHACVSLRDLHLVQRGDERAGLQAAANERTAGAE